MRDKVNFSLVYDVSCNLCAKDFHDEHLVLMPLFLLECFSFVKSPRSRSLKGTYKASSRIIVVADQV